MRKCETVFDEKQPIAVYKILFKRFDHLPFTDNGKTIYVNCVKMCIRDGIRYW